MGSPLVETDGIYCIFNDSINSGQHASSWELAEKKNDFHGQLATILKQISLTLTWDAWHVLSLRLCGSEFGWWLISLIDHANTPLVTCPW